MCAEIKRRLKRFYRKIEGDKIIYTDTPTNNIKQEVKKVESKLNESSKNDFENHLEVEHKKVIIDKILDEMKNNISPDVDQISEMIYNQLKKNNVEIDQNTIHKVVSESDHFRASKQNTNSNESIDTNNKDNDRNRRVNEREELTHVIDNIYDQIEKNKIREESNKNKKTNLKQSIIDDEDLKSDDKEDKEKNKEKQENKTKDENSKSKLKEKKESKTKDSNSLDLNFDDDEDFEDDLSNDDDDDGLGLKF